MLENGTLRPEYRWMGTSHTFYDCMEGAENWMWGLSRRVGIMNARESCHKGVDPELYEVQS